MICNNCQAENKEGAKFCAKCGSPISPSAKVAEETIACQKCGKILKLNAKFCGGCGNSSQQTETVRAQPFDAVPVAPKIVTLPQQNTPAQPVARKTDDITPLPFVAQIADETKACPRCHKALKLGAKFCGGCGFSYQQTGVNQLQSGNSVTVTPKAEALPQQSTPAQPETIKVAQFEAVKPQNVQPRNVETTLSAPVKKPPLLAVIIGGASIAAVIIGGGVFYYYLHYKNQGSVVQSASSKVVSKTSLPKPTPAATTLPAQAAIPASPQPKALTPAAVTPPVQASAPHMPAVSVQPPLPLPSAPAGAEQIFKGYGDGGPAVLTLNPKGHTASMSVDCRVHGGGEVRGVYKDTQTGFILNSKDATGDSSDPYRTCDMVFTRVPNGGFTLISATGNNCLVGASCGYGDGSGNILKQYSAQPAPAEKPKTRVEKHLKQKGETQDDRKLLNAIDQYLDKQK